jgi:hypothetical protein
VYTVYKVINKLNGQFYVGVHKTNNPYDSYMGSGLRIERSIKKHGKDFFSKEILFCFVSKQEAYIKEKELLSELLKK